MLLHSPDRAVKWTIAATCLAAYVLLAWISLIHVHKGLPITPWDPGLGVVFALMAFAGPQAGFVLFGGVVIAEVLVLRHEVEWPVIIGIAAITSLSYTAVTILARQILRIDIGLFHLRDVLMLLAVGFTGAYTTFSTFEFESATLLRDGSGFLATLYIAGSVFLGLLAVRLGIALAEQ